MSGGGHVRFLIAQFEADWRDNIVKVARWATHHAIVVANTIVHDNMSSPIPRSREVHFEEGGAVLERQEMRLDDQTHGRFWTQEKFETLRKAMINLKDHLKAHGLDMQEIHRRITANAEGEVNKSADGFARHFREINPDKMDRRPKRPRNLRESSIACGIVAKHLIDQASDWDVDKDAQTVVELYNELVKEEILHDLASLVQYEPQAVSVINRNKVDVEHLRRFLRVVPAKKQKADPANPEFPLNAPRFPATHAIATQEKISASSDEEFILVIKDESLNGGGSHKDRWALEMLFFYREQIEKAVNRYDALDCDSGIVDLPSLSLISSGGAAFALQSLLSLYNLPPLHVVMHDSQQMRNAAEKLSLIGAVVKHVELFGSEKDRDYTLEKTDVLAATDNHQGWEITTREPDEPYERAFYDWLICEIILEKPDFIFVPFGTGDLYGSILSVIERETREGERVDDRLAGLVTEDIKGIHVIGATTNNPNSSMDKLFSAYQPSKPALRTKAAALKKQGIVGEHSAVLNLEETWAVDARKEFEGSDKYVGRAEASGTAGLGLFRRMQDELEKDLKPVSRTGTDKDGEVKVLKKVLVVNTGIFNVAY